jgi:septal ring factor EnvC (AmiA/AmiB activator)
MSSEAENESPALRLLTEHKDRYASELKRLNAQLKGVEAKITSTTAKLEATTEALDALREESKKSTAS